MYSVSRSHASGVPVSSTRNLQKQWRSIRRRQFHLRQSKVTSVSFALLLKSAVTLYNRVKSGLTVTRAAGRRVASRGLTAIDLCNSVEVCQSPLDGRTCDWESKVIVRLSTFVALLVFIGGCAGGGSDTQQPPPPPPPAPTVNQYATSFPLTEYPISEGGKWLGGLSVGLDWSDIGTIANTNAYPVMQSGQYADATAILDPSTTGTWGSNETVVLKVYDSSPSTTMGEVAVRCHSALSANSSTGYEIGWRLHATSGAYNGVTRWNGPYGDFTSISALNQGPQYGVDDGDVIVVTCSQTGVITGYKCPGGANCVQQVQVTDTTFLAGTPGFGLDAPEGTQLDYGISCFAASDESIPNTVTASVLAGCGP